MISAVVVNQKSTSKEHIHMLCCATMKTVRHTEGKRDAGINPPPLPTVLGPFAASAPCLCHATFFSESCRWATSESHR